MLNDQLIYYSELLQDVNLMDENGEIVRHLDFLNQQF